MYIKESYCLSIRLTGLAVSAVLVPAVIISAAAAPHDEIQRFRGFLAGVPDKYWPPDRRTIPVCWEAINDAEAHNRETVRLAVENTWVKNSRIRFSGWEQCHPNDPGIHVYFLETRPETKELGQDLDRVASGMVLNATFQYYGSSRCKAYREACLKATTAHEFGHALGFVHENLRADAPDECLGEKRGVVPGIVPATPQYDRHSIMNYCNEDWVGDGSLSAFDKQGVAAVYGPPT